MSTTPRPAPSPRPEMDGRVAESGLEYLIMTVVQHYQQQQLGPSPQAALSAIGFRIGRLLAERLTKDRPPITEQLDIMKWLCKELWSELFKKSVDNLRTNHRGTYVLRDTQFRWTIRMSQNLVNRAERINPSELAADYLVLPCAIIKGALAALGLQSTVTADAAFLPQCDFTVVLQTPVSMQQSPAAAGAGVTAPQ